MGTSSLEGPKRALEVVVAYLMLGCRDGGVRIGVKGGHALTQQLQALVGRGDMAIKRADRSAGRLVHRVHTTPQGIDRLADFDRRYGEDFATGHVIPTLKADTARRA